MPELPDITVYVEALEERVLDHCLRDVRLPSPSLLRSVEPPVAAAIGRPVTKVFRMGKRIVFEFGEAKEAGGDADEPLFFVLHLMIAGRLQWKKRGAAIPRKRAHGAFDFDSGSLLITEASTKKRASLHVVRGREALTELDPVGLEVLEADLDAFRTAFLRERHTLKRTLTDPQLFSGIGNAYSDEILHRAGLSPVRLNTQLDEAETVRLYEAIRATLEEWTQRLRAQRGDDFPEKVTAFRPEMAVHGRFRKPCPVCSAPVQRIVRAESEVNYCPGCQTGGKILADRALSKLLGQDWPRSLEELEQRRPGG